MQRLPNVALLALLLFPLLACNLGTRPVDLDTASDDNPSVPAAQPITYDPNDPLQPGAITNPAFPSLTYGIQAFLWWDGGERGINLDMIRMLGFTHVKHTFAWRDLEGAPGQWTFGEADAIMDAADARGLKIVARLGETSDWAVGAQAGTDIVDTPAADLSTWGNYCGTVAGRYAGRVVAYQVWNEPNLSREWGGNPPDAARYTEMLRVCSEAIRAADPAAKIISAGLAPTATTLPLAIPDDEYLQAMYDAGFTQYVDAVGVHAPGYNAPEISPDEVEANGGLRFQSFRRVEDLRRIMVQNGDAAKQMAILEVGYTTERRPESPNYWFRVSAKEQADMLRRAYTYAVENWRPWMGLMSTIYMTKPTWTEADEEYWWSITMMRDGQVHTRPAFSALAEMPKYCDDKMMPARTPDEVPNVLDNPCL